MSTRLRSTPLEQDVARILDTVRPVAAPRPALVVLVGLPGSGKTHLARELSRRSGAAVLESDAIRRMLFRERRYSRWEHRRVFAAIHGAIDALLAAKALVIDDATNLAERERTPLYVMAERHGAALFVIHVVAADDVTHERLVQRTSGEASNSEAGLSTYERMRRRIEPISRPHRVINTAEDIGPALDALTKEILES